MNNLDKNGELKLYFFKNKYNWSFNKYNTQTDNSKRVKK